MRWSTPRRIQRQLHAGRFQRVPKWPLPSRRGRPRDAPGHGAVIRLERSGAFVSQLGKLSRRFAPTSCQVGRPGAGRTEFQRAQRFVKTRARDEPGHGRFQVSRWQTTRDAQHSHVHSCGPHSLPGPRVFQRGKPQGGSQQEKLDTARCR